MIKDAYIPYEHDYNGLVELTNNFNYAMYSYGDFCDHDTLKRNHETLNENDIHNNYSEFDYFHYPSTKIY